MMRNVILFTFAILLVTSTAMADNRSMTQMRNIAAAKLNRTAAVKGLQTRVKPATLQCVAEDNAYTIFAPQGEEGFVIVAKSDLVKPVIGYSSERYDAEDVAPAFLSYLCSVSRFLTAVENGQVQAPRRTAAYTPVENFVTTKWSQDYPFNRKTPNNCPTGCVATALAQCLNYCQYPPSADFDGNYSVTTKQGNKEKTEWKTEHVSTTYTWPYKDSYKTKGTPGDNIDELLRDCGYAAYMKYTSEYGGTPSLFAGIALTQSFQYSEASVKYYDRDNYGIDQESFIQMIYDELALRCPVFYGSFNSEGGHAFLLTGVDEEGLVYANWGWRGNQDGFYAIELMDPDGQGDGFTNSPTLITGIRPTPLATDKKLSYISSFKGNPYTFRWGTSSDDGVEHPTLYCDLPYGLVNWCPVSFQGVFGLFAQDLTDGNTWVIAEDLQDRDTIPAGYGMYGESKEYESFGFYYIVDGEQGLKPGHTYRMAFGTKDDEEDIWHSIYRVGGELAYDITYSGDPETSTVDPEPKAVPTPTAIHAPLAAPAGAGQLPYYFDLSGRRITQPSRGFFIHNGRKVVR
ncbi:MAG: C10 family peptidase [Bacteroidaceae bacterium]|nr:C10 family peptidase [Bacteroidaceae bacterium]